MNDLISRQAAIIQLSHNKNKGDDEWELAVENDIQTIWKVPPAQPKKGKWIIKDDTEKFIAQCNCCRYIEDSRRINNFCPHCGADMREVTT